MEFQPEQYRFKLNERVKYSDGAGIPAGAGTVIGVATTAFPILGCGYIVKLDTPPSSYGYEAIVIYECHLTPLET